MKKKLAIWFITIFALIIIFTTVVLVVIKPFKKASDKNIQGLPDQIANDIIMYWDDFSDGDTNDWELSESYALKEQNDAYSLAGLDSGYALIPNTIGFKRDYAFKISYTLNSGIIAFSFNSSNNGRYILFVTEQEAILIKESSKSEFSVLAKSSAPETGGIHSVVMGCYDGNIQVFFDKQLYLKIKDKTPIKGGAVSIMSSSESNFLIHAVLINEFVNYQEDLFSTIEQYQATTDIDIKKFVSVLPLSALPKPVKSVGEFEKKDSSQEYIINFSDKTGNGKNTWAIVVITLFVSLVCLTILFIILFFKAKSVPTNVANDMINLSEREKEVFALMLKGLSMPEIANELFISLSTAKGHSDHIYKKLRVHSRHELLLKFLNNHNGENN